jgi:hypothetical protein
LLGLPRQRVAASRTFGFRKEAQNASRNYAASQCPEKQAHCNSQEKCLKIISNVRVEIGPMEVEIIAPRTLIPFVAQVNPNS